MTSAARVNWASEHPKCTRIADPLDLSINLDQVESASRGNSPIGTRRACHLDDRHAHGTRRDRCVRVVAGRLFGMTYLPSLYKCRGVPLKSPVCAICLD